MIFQVMCRQFVPSAAEGVEGSICYALRQHNGAIIEGWACASRQPLRRRRSASHRLGGHAQAHRRRLRPLQTSEPSRQSRCSPGSGSSSMGTSPSPPNSPRCSHDLYL
jgi:hypothetical protein